MENLEQIKLAIDVEIKHRYIDIHGKTQAFSTFIKKEAQKRCQKFIGYPMIQANEKTEETSLATITEEIFLLKKIKIPIKIHQAVAMMVEEQEVERYMTL